MIYEQADTSVLYHWDDPDLIPIRLSLPSPPSLSKIDGYGKQPKDQRFERVQIPPKLLRLEKIAIENLEARKASNKNFILTRFKVQKEFWTVLDMEREYYREEIEFIKRMWWHRIYGYWFFNHGKPTYITGWHFMYLNFWYMPDVKGGYPEFRDRDRKEYIFHDYTYKTGETFKKAGNDGYAIPNLDGTYDIVDIGKRVSYGTSQSKNRRSGNTNKGLNMVLEITSRTLGTDGGGIMSYTGKHARSQFDQKLMLAWVRWPVFFMPMCTSGNQPLALQFGITDSEFHIHGLQTEVTFADSASSKYYDGKKLIASLCDEEGKHGPETSVDERWMVLKNCHSQGNGALIHGYSYHPSTVEEYTSGGKAYKELMDKSCFYQRIKISGQTPSGLFRLFIPADEGLDGFIDSYGYSVRGQLKDYQREEGFTQTADEYLNAIRDYYKNLGTPEAMAEYRSQLKQFPLKYADSWLGEAGDIGFNLEIIDKRIIELQRQKTTVCGNFEWEGGMFHGKVIWVPDETNGRFNVSRLFTERANKRIRDVFFDPIEQHEQETWAPLDPAFATAGADPFKFKSSSDITKSKQYAKGGGMSDGGFSVIWEYDPLIDKDRPRSEWESERVICTYRFRPRTDDEYCEDILRACIWYGALLYPEMNITTIYKKFREWGYTGYLKYDVSADGIMKTEPGVHMLTGAKQEGFSLARDFIDYHGHKIDHIDLLMECKSIKAMDELRDYDLLASFIVALLGVRSKFSKILKRAGDTVDISGIVEMLKY